MLQGGTGAARVLPTISDHAAYHLVQHAFRNAQSDGVILLTLYYHLVLDTAVLPRLQPSQSQRLQLCSLGSTAKAACWPGSRPVH